jgi:hypothetical protein
MVIPSNPEIVWTDYLRYRAKLRSYDLGVAAQIIRFSPERYLDENTRRTVVTGKHNDTLVIIPYEKNGNAVIPVTIHAITRQQIKFRVQIGRFINV